MPLEPLYVLFGNPPYWKIPLNHGQYALIDEEDYDLVIQFKWFAKWNEKMRCYYACSSHGSKTTLMHRLVMGHGPGDPGIDHRDPNATLDNRKKNLRPCNQSQNMANMRPRRSSISGLKGVTKEVASKRGNKRFRARISVNRKSIWLGRFHTAEEAHAAYCDAAMRLQGEFSRAS